MNDITEKVANIIKHLPLTAKLQENEQAILLQHIEIKHFVPSETILHQGQNVLGLYVIVWGDAKVTAKLPDGKEAKLTDIHTKDFFGDMVLFHGGVATATIQAISPLSCLFLKIDVANALRIIYPEIYFKLTAAIAVQVCQRIKNTILKVSPYLNSSYLAGDENLNLVEQPVTAELLNDNLLSINLLKNLACFHKQDKHTIEALLKYMKLVKFPKKTVISDLLDNHYVFLIQGAVGVSIRDEMELKKFFVLGAGSLLINHYESIVFEDFNETFPFAYVTRENCTLLIISKEKVVHLYQQHRDLFFAFHRIIVDQLVMLLVAINKQLVRLEVQQGQTTSHKEA